MIYFRNFIYDISYFPYLDIEVNCMAEEYLLSLVQASSSHTSRQQPIIS